MTVGVGHGPVIHADGTATFRVWAPRAQRVTVELSDGEHALDPLPSDPCPGWFATRVPAGHGDDYALRLDGGDPLPDPASRWQPDGVHGRSRLWDPGRVAWSVHEQTWLPAAWEDAVVYELHVGTFTPEGTLDSACAPLAALADTGITHVELMPVNAFNGEHGWGYDGVGWFAVHEPYGGPDALARFVEAAHRAGLGVILDVVYNHLGPSGNFLPEFGPYLTDRYGTPWGEAVNLDGPGSDPVRAFVVANALGWLDDFHADGLRLDAVHGLVDTSATHILTELADAVARNAERTGRPAVIIAESDRCDPATITPRTAGGQGLDAQWADDLHHAIHTALTGEREGYYVDFAGLRDVASVYRRGWLFGGRYSHYRERTVGAPLPDDIDGHRLVTCIQNHDQVGNRACGERLTALVTPELVRVGILLLCASPTTPLLLMGEEFGEDRPFLYFTSHPEPALAEAVRSGRAEEFAAFTAFSGTVPDPQDPATFAASHLDWSKASAPAGIARRALWADLLALRRQQPALGNGRRDLVDVLTATDEHLVIVRGDAGGDRTLIAVNLSDTETQLDAPPGPWRPLLATDDERYGGRGGTVGIDEGQIALPASSGALFTT